MIFNNKYLFIINVMDSIQLLYDDILVYILNLITTKELIKFSQINKYFMNFFKRNIKWFRIDCSGSIITDEGLEYLKDVHTVDLTYCNKITDKGLEYLKGVHTINLHLCNKITDKRLEYLKGVHTINFTHCNQITDKGLEYLKGVHTIYLYWCNKITDKGLEYLKGVHT